MKKNRVVMSVHRLSPTWKKWAQIGFKRQVLETEGAYRERRAFISKYRQLKCSIHA